MNTEKTILAILVIIVLGGIVSWSLNTKQTLEPISVSINSFEECVKAGYPIMESYPEQCRTPDGRNFIHQVLPVATPAMDQIEFGKAITLKLNKKVTFSDGLIVILTEINDSRCPANVECFWQGELAPVLEVSGAKLLNPGEVHLGTVMTKSASVEDYTITLKDATETNATIVVTK